MTRKQVATASLALFVISLALPAVKKLLVGATDSEDPVYNESGIGLLFLGWTGIVAGIFSWFANPLDLIGMAFYGRGSRKHFQSLFTIALVLVLSTFTRVGVPTFQLSNFQPAVSVLECDHCLMTRSTN